MNGDMNGERMAIIDCNGGAAMKALGKLFKADVGANFIYIH